MEIGGHLHVPVTLLQEKEHQLYHSHKCTYLLSLHPNFFFRRLSFTVSKQVIVFSETHTMYVT